MLFKHQVNIEGKIVGRGAPVYIIAEAGVAHLGDHGKAMALVDLAVDGGADAFKTQAFTTNTLISARSIHDGTFSASDADCPIVVPAEQPKAG